MVKLRIFQKPPVCTSKMYWKNETFHRYVTVRISFIKNVGVVSDVEQLDDGYYTADDNSIIVVSA